MYLVCFTLQSFQQLVMVFSHGLLHIVSISCRGGTESFFYSKSYAPVCSKHLNFTSNTRKNYLITKRQTSALITLSVWIYKKQCSNALRINPRAGVCVCVCVSYHYHSASIHKNNTSVPAQHWPVAPAFRLSDETKKKSCNNEAKFSKGKDVAKWH